MNTFSTSCTCRSASSSSQQVASAKARVRLEWQQAWSRCHRSQMGKARPEPIAGRKMRAMQRPCLPGKETLPRVVGIPEIEIADLWAFDTHDTEKMPGRDSKAPGIARRHDHIVNFGPAFAGGPITVEIGRRQRIDGITDYGGHAHPRRAVRGSNGFRGGRDFIG
jgi:hypothetical protein